MRHKDLRVSDLMYGLEGNEIAVYDRNREDDNGILMVATIDENRVVKFSDQPLSPQQKDAINGYAVTADPTVAITQRRVFTKRPIRGSASVV